MLRSYSHPVPEYSTRVTLPSPLHRHIVATLILFSSMNFPILRLSAYKSSPNLFNETSTRPKSYFRILPTLSYFYTMSCSLCSNNGHSLVPCGAVHTSQHPLIIRELLDLLPQSWMRTYVAARLRQMLAVLHDDEIIVRVTPEGTEYQFKEILAQNLWQGCQALIDVVMYAANQTYPTSTIPMAINRPRSLPEAARDELDIDRKEEFALESIISFCHDFSNEVYHSVEELRKHFRLFQVSSNISFYSSFILLTHSRRWSLKMSSVGL